MRTLTKQLARKNLIQHRCYGTMETNDLYGIQLHSLLKGTHFTPLLVCCFVGVSTFESACVLVTEDARVDGSNLVSQ